MRVLLHLAMLVRQLVRLLCWRSGARPGLSALPAHLLHDDVRSGHSSLLSKLIRHSPTRGATYSAQPHSQPEHPMLVLRRALGHLQWYLQLHGKLRPSDLLQPNNSMWQLQPDRSWQSSRLQGQTLTHYHIPVSKERLCLSQVALHPQYVSCRDGTQLGGQVSHILDMYSYLRGIYFWEPEYGLKHAGSIAERGILKSTPFPHPSSSVKEPAIAGTIISLLSILLALSLLQSVRRGTSSCVFTPSVWDDQVGEVWQPGDPLERHTHKPEDATHLML